MKRRVAAWFTLAVITFAARAVWTQRAGFIDSISPASGRAGDVITIRGNGFGAFNVRVTLGGVPATVLAANGNAVTFRVPPNVPPGVTTVVATNPGGRSGTIAFRLLEGVLLAGPSGALATTAETDLPPRAVGRDDVLDGGLLLTRLSLWLRPNATVGQVNAALTRVQGGIVSMRPGGLVLIIGVPRQASMEGLEPLIQTLKGSPGIATALPERESADDELPPPPQRVGTQVFPTRFPAAWNARALALRGCQTRRVPILVVDQFLRPAPPPYDTFLQEIPHFLPSPPDETGTRTHGYDVTTTMAAKFNDNEPTGANPVADCLDITGVHVAGLGHVALIDRIVRNFPAGKFIINYSQGYAYRCDLAIDIVHNLTTCDPTWVDNNVPTGYERAHWAALWKAKTATRWRDFLVASSAGNGNDPSDVPNGVLGTIYPGAALALSNNFITSAIDPDPFFGFVQSASLWKPHQPTLGLPDLTLQPSDVASLHDLITSLGAGTIRGADNTVIVGSVGGGNTFSALHDSKFSNFGADLMAKGENVFTMGGGTTEGTSSSAPQVAGLASYLWLLSDDLRQRADAIAATRTAIELNAPKPTGTTEPVIDAYAAVLSLDQAALPTPATAPVRLAILDYIEDQTFDEKDLRIFAAQFLDADGHEVEPSTPDFSRWDLNGDGFTGGSRVGQFDLNRAGSTQYGNTVYDADVSQTIEDRTVHYNENGVTDFNILCYYAYSGLYTGDAAARKQLLPGCAGVTVKVQPSSITLLAGATQAFSATVDGSTDPRVTWSTDAPGATISNAGVLTLGGAAGTFTVTATSVVDANAKGKATVIVTAPAPGHGSGLVRAEADGSAQFDPNCDNPIKSPDDTKAWSQTLNCVGTFTTRDGRVFDASAHASMAFDETQTSAQLTSATAAGAFSAAAHGSKNPALPPSQQDNSRAEASGHYELVFQMSSAGTVTIQGSLTGNAASIQLQYGCTGGGGIQFGEGPVDRTFTVAAGGSCKFVVLADAELLALDNAKPQSPNAGFSLHVEVH